MTPRAPLKKSGGETATVAAILQYLRLRGHTAMRMNSRVVMLPGKGGKDRPYRMGVKGMADIIGWVDFCQYPTPGYRAIPCTGRGQYHVPRWLAIEVKSATGQPTPEQTAFLAAVVKAGGLAFVARSVRDVQEKGL